MTERIKAYKDYIDALLAGGGADTDWDDELKKHLVQIQFFMHERLIHLIVTVLFALMAIIVLGIFLTTEFSIPLMLLFLLIMVLLVPYVKHYYLLENSVQYMYRQYDRMMAKKTDKAFSVKE